MARNLRDTAVMAAVAVVQRGLGEEKKQLV